MVPPRRVMRKRVRARAPSLPSRTRRPRRRRVASRTRPRIRIGGVERVRGAEFARPGPACALRSIATIGARLEHAPGEQRRQADAAEADDGKRRACDIAAVLTTAPTPVITAQPNSAASANGRSGSTRTSERRETVVNSANPETPRWWLTRLRRAGRAARAREQRACGVRRKARLAERGPARPQGRSAPQLGTNAATTWSPRFRSVTPWPRASTMPAISWPSTIGIGRGRLPSMTERSEWHRPAARTRTSTSPGPGGASSNSSIASGSDSHRGLVGPAHVTPRPLFFMARA